MTIITCILDSLLLLLIKWFKESIHNSLVLLFGWQFIVHLILLSVELSKPLILSFIIYISNTQFRNVRQFLSLDRTLWTCAKARIRRTNYKQASLYLWVGAIRAIGLSISLGIIILFLSLINELGKYLTPQLIIKLLIFRWCQLIHYLLCFPCQFSLLLGCKCCLWDIKLGLFDVANIDNSCLLRWFRFLFWS